MNGKEVGSTSLVNGETENTMTATYSKQQPSETAAEDGTREKTETEADSSSPAPHSNGLSNGGSVGDDAEQEQSDQRGQASPAAETESAMDMDTDAVDSVIEPAEARDGPSKEQENSKDAESPKSPGPASDNDEHQEEEEAMDVDDEKPKVAESDNVDTVELDSESDTETAQKQDAGSDKGDSNTKEEGKDDSSTSQQEPGTCKSTCNSPVCVSEHSNKDDSGAVEEDKEIEDSKADAEVVTLTSSPVGSRADTPVIDSRPSSVVETSSRSSSRSAEVISLMDSDTEDGASEATPSVDSSCVSTPVQSRSVTPSQTGSQSTTPVPSQQGPGSTSVSPTPGTSTADASPAAPEGSVSPKPATTVSPQVTTSTPVASTSGTSASTPSSTPTATPTATPMATPTATPTPTSAAEPTSPKKLTKMERLLPLSRKEPGLRPMADLLVDVGQSLVCQQVYRDLVRVQRKKRLQNRLTEVEQEQLTKMEGLYEVAVELNQPFHMDEVTCNRCGFHSESRNVLELHREYAHLGPGAVYLCSFCDTTSVNINTFFNHMSSAHRRKGRIHMKMSQFVCPLCPYEQSSKAVFFKHLTKCHRNFNLNRNSEPLPADSDIPLKKMKMAPQPQHAGSRAQLTRPSILKPYQEGFGVRGPRGMSSKTVSSILGHARTSAPILRQPPPAAPTPQMMPMMPNLAQSLPPGATITSAGASTPQYVQLGGNYYALMMHNGRQMLVPVVNPNAPNQTPVSQMSPLILPGLQGAQLAQQQLAKLGTPRQSLAPRALPPRQLPPRQAVAIPRQQTPRQQTPNKGLSSALYPDDSSFQVCEICGGFVKDRESLRVHFMWAHKVDLPKDVFYKKQAYLFCTVCRQRFWTYQGLSRHQRLKHGSPAKQAAPPPPKPILHTCIVCNKKDFTDILEHLHSVHGISADMQISMKTCMVCGKALGTEPETKHHLQQAHPTIFINKNAALAPKKPAPAPAQSPQRPIPASRPGPASSKPGARRMASSQETYCPQCCIEFTSISEYLAHRHANHTFRCPRCPVKSNRYTSYSTVQHLKKHYKEAHEDDEDPCPICHQMVGICAKFIHHAYENHLKECSVKVGRLSQAQLAKYTRSPSPKPVDSKPTEAAVVIVEDSPVKKPTTPTPTPTPTRPPPEGVGRRTRSSRGMREEIIEVDGEQVIVQQQESDSDE